MPQSRPGLKSVEGQERRLDHAPVTSDPPRRTDIFSVRRHVSKVPIVLQNSRNAVGSISRKLTKQAPIAERCSLQAITEVAREFIAG
jgi:hypothetical protein